MAVDNCNQWNSNDNEWFIFNPIFSLLQKQFTHQHKTWNYICISTTSMNCYHLVTVSHHKIMESISIVSSIWIWYNFTTLEFKFHFSAKFYHWRKRENCVENINIPEEDNKWSQKVCISRVKPVYTEATWYQLLCSVYIG